MKMREDIIKLAKEAHIHFDEGFHFDLVSIDELERFHTLAVAPLQEQIAAQQARISELRELVQLLRDYIPASAVGNTTAQEALSRTDEMSALEAECKRHYQLGVEQGLSQAMLNGIEQQRRIK